MRRIQKNDALYLNIGGQQLQECSYLTKLLVKRKGNTDYSNCWALIPSGTSDNFEEVKKPSIALEREAKEELLIHKDGLKLDPIIFSTCLTKNPIKIIDSATNQTYEDNGELFVSDKDKHLFFGKVYKFNIPLEKLKISDGELLENLPLNREIKFIDFSELLSMKVETPSLKWGKKLIKKYLKNQKNLKGK